MEEKIMSNKIPYVHKHRRFAKGYEKKKDKFYDG